MPAKQSTQTKTNRAGIWGPIDLDKDSAYGWHIGPLLLWAERLSQEVRISYKSGTDPSESTVSGPNKVTEPLPEDLATTRFASGEMNGRLLFEPALADRNTVVRPDTPFSLLPGGNIDLFITTPLWVRVDARKPKQALLDIPTFRPSDTWFGPSTIEGELCYAGRTHARLTLAKVDRHAARAITVIRLKNLTEDPMEIDKVNIPIPHLALYETDDGTFWTQGVSATWTKEEDRARVTLQKGPPPESKGAKLVSPPRRKESPNIMVRAVWKLLMR